MPKMATTTQMFKHPIDRYPRLDTVIMIQDFIHQSGGALTIRQIWQQLPKKVMWQTYLTVLDYLEHQGDIMVLKDKTIIWTRMSEKVKEMIRNGSMPQVR